MSSENLDLVDLNFSILFFFPFQLNLGIYIKDKKSEFSVLVDRATGGASIKDGEVELMLHRYNTKQHAISSSSSSSFK